MTIRRLLLGVLFFSLSVVSQATRQIEVNNELILFVYEEFPPFFMESDGEVTGLFGGKARDVFDAAGLHVKWQQVSFKRLMDVLATSPKRICTAGYGWKQQRAAKMRFSNKFADGPASIVIAHQDVADVIHSFVDVEALQADKRLTGVYLDLPLDHDFFSVQPDLKSNHIFVMAEDKQMFDMVRTGRVDYAFLNEETAKYLNNKIEVEDRIIIVPLKGLSSGHDRFILCTTSVSEWEMQRLNEGIRLVENSAH